MKTSKKPKTPKPLTLDASWDQPTLPTSEEEWKVEGPDKVAPPSTDWGAEQGSDTEAAEGEPASDWDVSPNVTLNIAQHSGRFNPSQAKILVYGETGMQKTRMASTFPHVIFADVDHGMASVTEKVDTVYIEDNNQGFEQLKKLYAFLKAGEHEYETVVLDTLNEMQRVIMRFTIEEYSHVRRSYGNLPGQSDYGKMLYEFLELTRDYISLPMRVVLLAQVSSKVFDTDTLMPQLIGKNTAREILRKMDVVGYIYRQDGEGDRKVPVISFDAVDYVTKDRSNKLPAALPDPSYAAMAAYWR
jgi:hypothetical protein